MACHQRGISPKSSEDTLHYISLHYITLHCFTLLLVELQYSTLHELHYIGRTWCINCTLWRWVWRIRVSWWWIWQKGRRWGWRSVKYPPRRPPQQNKIYFDEIRPILDEIKNIIWKKMLRRTAWRTLWRTVNLTLDLSPNLTVTKKRTCQSHRRPLCQPNRQASRMRH